MWHAKGKCLNGSRCRFAHGRSELRHPSNVVLDGMVDEQSEEFQILEPANMFPAGGSLRTNVDSPMKVQLDVPVPPPQFMSKLIQAEDGGGKVPLTSELLAALQIYAAQQNQTAGMSTLLPRDLTNIANLSAEIPGAAGSAHYMGGFDTKSAQANLDLKASPFAAGQAYLDLAGNIVPPAPYNSSHVQAVQEYVQIASQLSTLSRKLETLQNRIEPDRSPYAADPTELMSLGLLRV